MSDTPQEPIVEEVSEPLHPRLNEFFAFETTPVWHRDYFIIHETLLLAQKPLDDLTDEETMLIRRLLQSNPLFAMTIAGIHKLKLITTDDSN